MKKLFKSKQAVEFLELAEQLRAVDARKYNWSEIARISQVGPQMISLIRQGERNPGRASFNCLRRYVEDLRAGKLPAEDMETDRHLAVLKKNHPAAYRAAQVNIKVLFDTVTAAVEAVGHKLVDELQAHPDATAPPAAPAGLPKAGGPPAAKS